jgi:hypothetical protein
MIRIKQMKFQTLWDLSNLEKITFLKSVFDLISSSIFRLSISPPISLEFVIGNKSWVGDDI